MPNRGYPFSNFNFIVNLGGRTGDGTQPIGGFSEVNGLNTEITFAEYRPGNYKTNSTAKYPNVHKTGAITLKRGLVSTTDLWDWLKEVRDGAYKPRGITITLLDESRQNPVMTWQITNAQPQKWTAPPLNAKGGTDVAIEELTLVCEGVEVVEA
jgi:phage tail-like protein